MADPVWVEGEGFSNQNGPEAGENRFSNKSGPKGELNPGGRSKFNPEQQQDRLRVHAIAIATGTPTFAQIVDYWKEKYNIDVTVPTEKEFRKVNRNKIERLKGDLIESGDISIPVVSEEILADSLMDVAIQTSSIAKDIRKKATAVLRRIKVEGTTTDEEAKANKEAIKLFEILVESMSKLNKNTTDQIDKLFGFSSKIKIKDKRVQQLVDERFNERMRTAEEADEDEEIADGELITDEVRQALLAKAEAKGSSED